MMMLMQILDLIMIIMMRLIPFLWVLPSSLLVAAYEKCSICGDHRSVANLNGEVPYDGASHPCGVTEELGLSGELEQCQGGRGRLVDFEPRTFRSDDDGYYLLFSCKCVRIDTIDNPCHVCGENRIVSRPLATIQHFHKYLGHYSCQGLQDDRGFDFHCNAQGYDLRTPEMLSMFEENCGCEERTICNICAPGQKDETPNELYSVTSCN